MPAEILSTHTPALLAAAVEQAAARLAAGDVVAVPTETVYGLAAHALNPDAVARLFALKGRPAHNPIIVHVASATMARACSSAWPPLADALGAAFWPGPLTLVVPRSEQIPPLVTAGGSTVGVRWPQHPFMQAVIRRCGFPLAAPSANLANRLSPTSARHVQAQLGDVLPLIVDGGDCNVGIESTVVDVTGPTPVILRPGMIAEPEILRAAASSLPITTPTPPDPGNVLRSPGQLERHYAPRARLVVWSWKEEEDLLRQLSGIDLPGSNIHVLAHTRIPLSGRLSHVKLIPDDPEAFARALYAELHRCDEEGAEMIVVEALPEGPAWMGIADRLRRATAKSRPGAS